MRKAFTIALCFLLLSQCFAQSNKSYSGFVVVCDIDDTYKITNTVQKSSSVINALFSKKTFAGMDDLLAAMCSAEAKLYFLSNSPRVLKGRILKIIEKNNLQYEGLYLRKAGEQGIGHKMTKINELIEKHPSDMFIFIGDDSENDALVYDSIRKRYPDKVAAIYIHHIIGKNSFSSYRFYTAVDIAYFECNAGRMESVVVNEILDEVMSSELQYVMPKYILFNEELMLQDVAGCFELHCLAKNRTIEWLIDCWYKH